MTLHPDEEIKVNRKKRTNDCIISDGVVITVLMNLNASKIIPIKVQDAPKDPVDCNKEKSY